MVINVTCNEGKLGGHLILQSTPKLQFGRRRSIFIDHSDFDKTNKTYSEDDICRILEFFIRMNLYIQSLLQRKEKKTAKSFGYMFRYIDDVLSLNNSKFGDYVYRISYENRKVC